MLESETSRILIVDDCLSLSNLAQHIIASQQQGYDPICVQTAQEALTVLQQEDIRLVLTDYQMPGMNGLELLQAIQQTVPEIPVIVMTAFQDARVELDALSLGAAGFIHKSRLAQELPGRLITSLSAGYEGIRRHSRLSYHCIHEQTTRFIIPNDRTLVPEIVVSCQEQLELFEICARQDQIRVGIAIEEAIINAMIHGNLEVNSKLRGFDDEAHCKLIERHSNEEPYASRQLHLEIQMTSNLARFVIRDEGPGFDIQSLPDPTDPENIIKASGRGILLIRSFMDEVRYNQCGNEITIIKYKTVPDETAFQCSRAKQDEPLRPSKLQNATVVE